MPNPWFQFKQFTVWQDRCGMKVGTDGVLLGAWVNAAGPLRVLDIGTGTGIISLMIAQRTSGKIYAVEIEKDAGEQAWGNFSKSPWAGRLHIFNTSIQDFSKNCTEKYDLIVSNPPFFNSKPKASEQKRALARHSDKLPIKDLVSIATQLLSTNGRFAVILPMDLRQEFIAETSLLNLWVLRETIVKPNPQKSPVRVLLEVAKTQPVSREINELAIRESTGDGYSDSYKALTKEYYLLF